MTKPLMMLALFAAAMPLAACDPAGEAPEAPPPATDPIVIDPDVEECPRDEHPCR